MKKKLQKISQKILILMRYIDLMPDEKAKIVKKLTGFGNVVMVGDGVNDTLAMSMANTSISFASGGSEGYD